LIPAGFFNLDTEQIYPAINWALDTPETNLTNPEKPQWCPKYFYCPEGTNIPLPCEDGTWTPWEGARSPAECIPCERGKFCRFTSMMDDYGPESDEPSFTTYTDYYQPFAALPSNSDETDGLSSLERF
jgi:hypothetical protein